MHPPLAATNVFLCTYLHEFIKLLYSSGMQQQQPSTVTHSRISSLRISRRLSWPKLLQDSQFRLPAILNNSLASYDNNYVCHGVHLHAESGHGNSKIFARTSPEPSLSKFLNPPLYTMTPTKCCFCSGHELGRSTEY